MLVMLRRVGEAILIREDIEIHILSVSRSRVRIGIRAPKEIRVIAREVELVQRENQAAAESRSQQALALAIAGILDQASRPPADKQNKD